MLKFSAEQHREIVADAREESVQRIFALLREHYGATSVWRGDEAGVAVVRAAIVKAEGHAMTAERDVFKLAALMLVFGDAFDTQEPWAREIVAAREGDAPIAELLYREGIAQVRRREAAAP